MKVKNDTDNDDIETILHAKTWNCSWDWKTKFREREKNIKSGLEQDKVDIQVSRQSDIKKVQDVFDEIKEEEPLNIENFFIDDNDIFDSEEISNVDREFIIALINSTNFIPHTEKFVEESNESKMEIVHPEEKTLRRRNKYWLTMTKREKMLVFKIV